MNIEGIGLALGGVITAVGTVIGALALFERARGANARPVHLLRRMRDALQTLGLWDHLPEGLRSEVEEHLSEDDKK